jgi:hypothetical protein
MTTQANMSRKVVPVLPLMVYAIGCWIFLRTPFYDPLTFHTYALMGFGPVALLSVALGTRGYTEPIRTVCFLLTTLILLVLLTANAKAAGGIGMVMHEERDSSLYVQMEGQQWMFDKQGRMIGVDLGGVIYTYHYPSKFADHPDLWAKDGGPWQSFQSTAGFGVVPPIVSLPKCEMIANQKDACDAAVMLDIMYGLYGGVLADMAFTPLVNYNAQQASILGNIINASAPSGCNAVLDEFLALATIGCGAFSSAGWGAVMGCQAYQYGMVAQVRAARCPH